MVLASYFRLAALGAGLFFSQAQASTFGFTPCVENCIASSGCDADSARCVCKEARSLLLDSVVSCLFFNCKPDLVDFEDAFLDPVEEGCEDHDRDIPESKLKAAESLASSYISKLPSPTTIQTTTAEAPKTTTKPIPTKPTETSSSSPATTKTQEEDTKPSSSATDGDADQPTTETSAPTDVVPPTSASQTSATPTESPSSDDSDSDQSDVDPFATSDNAVSAVKPLVTLLGLPLAVAVLALR
ncbi:hypothetical protein P885DRAFT_74886 [Corynascus similis CBS 632.67]